MWNLSYNFSNRVNKVNNKKIKTTNLQRSTKYKENKNIFLMKS